ncbi:uncharacterized protein VTP21DRAFT_4357 [Calcarisporiella thermophila]|uniref:uncharacterized protein n=1 Tax=Calcarisporiella thermophila TaxID=911321 RepID=UPI0037442250
MHSRRALSSLTLQFKRGSYFNNALCTHSPTIKQTIKAHKFYAAHNIRAIFSSAKQFFPKKYVPNSIYLAAVIFDSNDRILLTPQRFLPTVPIVLNDPAYNWLDESNPVFISFLSHFRSFGDTFSYKFSEDLNPPPLKNNASAISDNLNQERRLCKGMLLAADRMKLMLQLEDIGFAYDSVIELKDSVKFLVVIRFVDEATQNVVASELLRRHQLVWKSPRGSLIREHRMFSELLNEYTSFFASRNFSEKGLYLGLFHLAISPAGTYILVAKGRKYMIPMISIRYESDTLSPEELKWLRWVCSLTKNEIREQIHMISSNPSTRLGGFQKDFISAYFDLQRHTGIEFDPSDLYCDGVLNICFPSLKWCEFADASGALDAENPSSSANAIMIVKHFQYPSEPSSHTLNDEVFSYFPIKAFESLCSASDVLQEDEYGLVFNKAQWSKERVWYARISEWDLQRSRSWHGNGTL